MTDKRAPGHDAELRKVALRCADEYVSLSNSFPDDAPDRLWDLAWNELERSVAEEAVKVCGAARIGPAESIASIEAALLICFERVDAVTAAQDELAISRGGLN